MSLFPNVVATLVEKTTCDFHSTQQQVQRGQINFALCSKTWVNLNTVMSVFTINYIILSRLRGFPPLNRNLFLLNRIAQFLPQVQLQPFLLLPVTCSHSEAHSK